jgi:hypothetical protein
VEWKEHEQSNKIIVEKVQIAEMKMWPISQMVMSLREDNSAITCGGAQKRICTLP